MSWSEHRLDELGSVGRGKSKHRPRDAAHLYGGPYPFIQTGDVKRAELYLTDYEQTYSESGLAQSKLWEPGTLCITIAANIAETAILDIEACFPDSVIGFVPDPEKADARYVKYLFDAMLKKRYQRFTQGAAQDNLSQGKLLSINFPVPDITVQRKIADTLSSYDELAKNNRRRIQLLEESARLLYREWFVHLRFPGHEHVKIVEGVPEGWERVSLGVALTLQRGFDLPVKDRHEGEVPVYASTGIVGFHNEGKAKGPGVVTGRSGSLGMVEYIQGEYWPLNTALWVKEFTCVTPEFAYYLLSGLGLENYNGGAAVPTLNRNNVHRIPVTLPPAFLMRDFSEHVETVFEQINTLRRYSQKLTEARDLLLPRLMNGEIAV